MVDFLEMQRNPEKFGIEPELIADLEKRIDFIFFKKNEKKPGVISDHKGMIVFPERGYENTFHENELWLCDLKKYDTTLKARPIEKIDASFFFELKSQQADMIADILWKEHKESMEPVFEKKFLATRERVESLTIEKYEQEVDKLKAHISQLERNAAADKIIIESLQKGEIKNESEPKRKTQSLSSPPGFPIFGELSAFNDHLMANSTLVKRIEPDIICSDVFVKTRYFVHISKDKKLMLIRPHEYGDAICINGRINLIGLGAILPFDGPKELFAEYNGTYGGLLINLR